MRDWKVVLMEQRAKTLQCWLEPFVHLRAPKIFHLRRDPFERADENSNTYYDWMIPTPTSSTPCRRWWANRLKTSGSSRRVRSRPPSTWMR